MRAGVLVLQDHGHTVGRAGWHSAHTLLLVTLLHSTGPCWCSAGPGRHAEGEAAVMLGSSSGSLTLHVMLVPAWRWLGCTAPHTGHGSGLLGTHGTLEVTISPIGIWYAGHGMLLSRNQKCCRRPPIPMEQDFKKRRGLCLCLTMIHVTSHVKNSTAAIGRWASARCVRDTFFRTILRAFFNGVLHIVWLFHGQLHGQF